MHSPMLVLLSALSAEALVLAPSLRPAVQQRAAAPQMSDFFAVYHTFKPGKSEEWWANMAGVDFAAMAKTQQESGIFGHSFLPADVEGPVLCVWESKEGMELGEFQAFIDGPESPAGDALINTPYKVMPGAFTPASAWPTLPKPAVPTAGSFFWVHHRFVNKAACASFWEAMASVDPAELEAKNKALGVHNHFFLPTGDSFKDDVFCVWETETPTSVAEFQAFIDGPDGPAPGTFVNTVYPVMDGAMAPSAAFPRSWLDETMAKVEALLKEGGLQVESLIAKLQPTKEEA